MTQLRQRMIDEMTLRGFSLRTHESYLGAVTDLARYYKKSPDQLNVDDVRQYLLHLERERQLSWSSLNVAVSGLRFFYFDTLKWEPVAMEIPRRQKQTRLPEVLSREEVDRLLGTVTNLKHRMLLTTTYAAGLRLNEVIHLRVSDLDSSRMLIRVEQGKGRKDRYTILSPRLLGELRQYWKSCRPKHWLFPGHDPDRPIHESAAQRIYNEARQRAGIQKGRGIHTLRHCFATHLLELGVDLPTIQALMGHTAVTTTMRYIKVRQHHFISHQDKFDLLVAPLKPPNA
jgi:integrase/recombinase XerD